MMYLDYYGFSRNPFDKHSLYEKDAFFSSDHKEMTSRLTYLKNTLGIGVFVSPPGFGKTYALRCFAKSLDRNLNEVVYISLSTVSITEFYKQLCSSLGLDSPHGKPAMLKAIKERIYSCYKDKKKPFIIVFDEAHELSATILKDIKMIMNFHFDSQSCFALALVGEVHLNNILDKPVHEALRQRITVHYSFSGLSNSETEQYLIHKIKTVGASPSILGEGTLSAIIGYAKGCPRLIDNLMNEALMLGAQMQKPSLDTDIIMAAANNLAL